MLTVGGQHQSFQQLAYGCYCIGDGYIENGKKDERQDDGEIVVVTNLAMVFFFLFLFSSSPHVEGTRACVVGQGSRQ